MKFDKRYHPRSFLLKLFMGKMLYGLFKTPYKHGDLLVLNYHSTPLWLIPEFEKQVRFFAEHFNIISPAELYQFYNGTDKRNSDSRPSVLFTFDDGLKNNLHAAALLEKYNSRGLFFLVPAFLDASAENQRAYYLKNIRNRVNFHIDTTPEDVTALSREEIGMLIQNGHRIGSHSLTHTMNCNDDAIKHETEILKSKAFLEKEFPVTIVDFCAPFDSLRSTGKVQMEIIKGHYKFFHATFPGSNADRREPFFIRRTNVECWWPMDVVKFALSEFEWKRWQPKREQFRKEVLGT